MVKCQRDEVSMSGELADKKSRERRAQHKRYRERERERVSGGVNRRGGERDNFAGNIVKVCVGNTRAYNALSA